MTTNDNRWLLVVVVVDRGSGQWQWQSLTAAIAVVIDVNNRTTGGADKFGQRTMQQARNNR